MKIRTQFAKIALATAALALLLPIVGCSSSTDSAEGQKKEPVNRKGVKPGGKLSNDFISTK